MQALDRPATCVTIILQIAIFVKIHSARFDYADVGASYDVSFVGNDLSKDHLEKIDIVVLLVYFLQFYIVIDVSEDVYHFVIDFVPHDTLSTVVMASYYHRAPTKLCLCICRQLLQTVNCGDC